VALSRDQFIARLLAGYPLRVLADTVWVAMQDAAIDDERVPAVFFAEFRAEGFIAEHDPGEWRITEKGRRRLAPL
jgi:hypothetical protein